jgi:hypothetical protein
METPETPNTKSQITPPNSTETLKFGYRPASVLSLEPPPYEELIQVGHRAAAALLSVNEWAHTLVPYGEPMWMSAMYTATVDFQMIPPPMRESPVQRTRPQFWRIQTVFRVLILLNFEQHAQWYADSSRAEKEAWLTELDTAHLLWMNDAWELDTIQHLSTALGRCKNRGLWQELRPFGGGNELLHAAVRNDLFLLYFAIGQDQDPNCCNNHYEDLRCELLKLGVRDTPRVPLTKLRASWFDAKGDKGVRTAMDRLTEVIRSAVSDYAVKYAAESSEVAGNSMW